MTARKAHLNGMHAAAEPKPPPHNRDAERALLGTMLRDNRTIDEIDRIVNASAFHVFGNSIIFRIVADLHSAGITPDLVTLHERLTAAGQMDEIGGVRYLAELWDAAPSAGNFRQYADIINQAWMRREMIRTGNAILQSAYDLGESPAMALQNFEKQIQEITAPGSRRIERFTIGEMLDKYPNLNKPVVDGLIRERETANIVSETKIGKSWFAYLLLLSIATGRTWLGRYPCAKGRVLLIDNELHRPTIAARIKAVAEALGIEREENADAIEIWSLRGNLRDIFAIEVEMRHAPGFKAIVLDAKYRMTPAGKSENDNNAETQYYNAIDRYAEMTGASIFNIAHSSKGDQSGKRVSDVGAGAGAQSRAADCHLVLRQHEDDGVVVLEALVRNFPPSEPVALQWNFPLWTPADGIDATKLRGRLSGQQAQQRKRDDEGIAVVVDRLMKGPATIRQLRDCGPTRERLTRLLGIMEKEGRVEYQELAVRGNDTREYRLKT